MTLFIFRITIVNCIEKFKKLSNTKVNVLKDS